MSTWFPEKKRTLLERLMIRILRMGRMPRHIAFIMDGNRRFADRIHADRLEGHKKGFEKLTDTLSWLYDLGVTDATVYAFSIENFKRPRSEVDGLMHLFRQQFDMLMQEFDKLESHQVSIRVYGNINLLPLDIQAKIARLVLSTAKFDRFRLNLAVAYTAREEIVNAINELGEIAQVGLVDVEDIDDATLNTAMYALGDMGEPDMVVRTSGETRLSDFLLWQSSFSLLAFVDRLWPDFSIWNLFYGVLRYQLDFDHIQQAKVEYRSRIEEMDELCLKYHRYPTINGFKTFPDFVETRRRQNKTTQDILQHERTQRLESKLESFNSAIIKKETSALMNGNSHDLSDRVNNNKSLGNGNCRQLN